MSTEQPSTLYTHEKHRRMPRNVNYLHVAEQAAAGFNTRLAVTLTKIVGSMWAAYAFTVLALIGLFGLLGWLNPFIFLLATWVSQQFLQLTLLSVIMVGQNVLSRHSELMAEEQYETTQHSYHDIGQIMDHLSKQDDELLRQTDILIKLLDKQQGDKQA